MITADTSFFWVLIWPNYPEMTSVSEALDFMQGIAGEWSRARMSQVSSEFLGWVPKWRCLGTGWGFLGRLRHRFCPQREHHGIFPGRQDAPARMLCDGPGSRGKGESGEGPDNPLLFLSPDLLGLVLHDTQPLPVAAHPRGPRGQHVRRQEACMVMSPHLFSISDSTHHDRLMGACGGGDSTGPPGQSWQG